VNYRHVYHAGNFADVFKHALLARMLVYLAGKPRPLRYLDTHAGVGRYDLTSTEATRGGEWRDGVGRLAGAVLSAEAEALLAPYRSALGPLEAGRAPRSYPGSPLIAQRLLRRQDRMIFCEAHPKDARRLAAAVGRDARAKAIEIDGYMALRAYTPPVERRGLVLIDPPFEAADELTTLRASLVEAWAKWPTGCYAIWRPLKDLRAARAFGAALVGDGMRDLLRLDLMARDPADGAGLAGSGLLIVNPPWVLEAEAGVLLPALAQLLAQGQGAGWSVRRPSEERGA
jgi:23S rRNA (adenine2030-N6)-methyltransferase